MRNNGEIVTTTPLEVLTQESLRRPTTEFETMLTSEKLDTIDRIYQGSVEELEDIRARLLRVLPGLVDTARQFGFSPDDEVEPVLERIRGDFDQFGNDLNAVGDYYRSSATNLEHEEREEAEANQSLRNHQNNLNAGISVATQNIARIKRGEVAEQRRPTDWLDVGPLPRATLEVDKKEAIQNIQQEVFNGIPDAINRIHVANIAVSSRRDELLEIDDMVSALYQRLLQLNVTKDGAIVSVRGKISSLMHKFNSVEQSMTSKQVSGSASTAISPELTSQHSGSDLIRVLAKDETEISIQPHVTGRR